MSQGFSAMQQTDTRIQSLEDKYQQSLTFAQKTTPTAAAHKQEAAAKNISLAESEPAVFPLDSASESPIEEAAAAEKVAAAAKDLVQEKASSAPSTVPAAATAPPAASAATAATAPGSSSSTSRVAPADICQVITPSPDAAYEPVCACPKEKNPQNVFFKYKNCITTGSRPVPAKDTIQSKFDVEVCTSVFATRDGLFSGTVNVRRNWGCNIRIPMTTVPHEQRNMIGPDDFQFTFEGPEIIDIGVALRFVGQQSDTCNYTAQFRFGTPGRYAVAFLHLIENFGAIREDIPRQARVNFDLPLGRGFVELGRSRAGDAAKSRTGEPRPVCTRETILSAGRFIQADLTAPVPILDPPRFHRGPYRGPVGPSCFRPALLIDPTQYRWSNFDCDVVSFSRQEGSTCLAGKRLRFDGDSHTRRLFNVLMKYACGLDNSVLKSWGTDQHLHGTHGSCLNLDATMVHDSTGDRAFEDDVAGGWIILNTGQHPASTKRWTYGQYQKHISSLAKRATQAKSSVIWNSSPSAGGHWSYAGGMANDWRTKSRLQIFNAIARTQMQGISVPVTSYFSTTSALAGKNPDGTHWTAEAVMPVVQQLLTIMCGPASGSGSTEKLSTFYPVSRSEVMTRIEEPMWLEFYSSNVPSNGPSAPINAPSQPTKEFGEH